MRVITIGNELLRQKAATVTDINDELIKTYNMMLEVMERDSGIGLAGPQVGIMERIFVTHVQGDIKRFFINPSILETSAETSKMEEGCLSIPKIYAVVARAKEIKIQAWNEKGRPFTLEASGLLARVILHEYDHLEGILFWDRLTEAKRQRLMEKYEKMTNIQK